MMWHGDWSGADWALMSAAMLLFWTAVVFGVIWLVRTVGRPGRRGAQDILDERYARGELTDEEYRARRDTLAAR